jgi:hypothetical protein
VAQFILGSYIFKTKGEATKSVQHILHSAPIGAPAADFATALNIIRNLQFVVRYFAKFRYREPSFFLCDLLAITFR